MKATCSEKQLSILRAERSPSWMFKVVSGGLLIGSLHAGLAQQATPAAQTATAPQTSPATAPPDSSRALIVLPPMPPPRAQPFVVAPATGKAAVVVPHSTPELKKTPNGGLSKTLNR